MARDNHFHNPPQTERQKAPDGETVTDKERNKVKKSEITKEIYIK